MPDVDAHHGAAVPGDLPDTLIASTPSGGRHLFYRVPDGRRGLQANNWRPGIDLRGEGGLVVAAPSKGRHWHDSPVDMSEAPEILLRQARRRRQPQGRIFPLGIEPKTCFESWLAIVAYEMADVFVGKRNVKPYRLTKDVVRDCHVNGDLALSLVAETMHRAGVAAGLSRDEAQATIRSAIQDVRQEEAA